MLACGFVPTVSCVYAVWTLLVSPLDLPTVCTLMDPRQRSLVQTLQISDRIPHTFGFSLLSPITVIGTTVDLVLQHQGDGELGGGPKVWFPLSIISRIQFNRRSCSAGILPLSLKSSVFLPLLLCIWLFPKYAKISAAPGPLQSPSTFPGMPLLWMAMLFLEALSKCDLLRENFQETPYQNL